MGGACRRPSPAQPLHTAAASQWNGTPADIPGCAGKGLGPQKALGTPCGKASGAILARLNACQHAKMTIETLWGGAGQRRCRLTCVQLPASGRQAPCRRYAALDRWCPPLRRQPAALPEDRESAVAHRNRGLSALSVAQTAAQWCENAMRAVLPCQGAFRRPSRTAVPAGAGACQGCVAYPASLAYPGKETHMVITHAQHLSWCNGCNLREPRWADSSSCLSMLMHPLPPSLLEQLPPAPAAARASIQRRLTLCRIGGHSSDASSAAPWLAPCTSQCTTARSISPSAP